MVDSEWSRKDLTSICLIGQKILEEKVMIEEEKEQTSLFRITEKRSIEHIIRLKGSIKDWALGKVRCGYLCREYYPSRVAGVPVIVVSA